MARLVRLSGPSCVGKGPLVSALGRHYPELPSPLVLLVLHNSRAPRPGEVDGVNCHFRPRADIERRVTSAILELRRAHKYDHVIPNHDGEDSENWDAFYYPVGDAFMALMSLAALLRDESPKRVERWEASLVQTTD